MNRYPRSRRASGPHGLAVLVAALAVTLLGAACTTPPPSGQPSTSAGGTPTAGPTTGPTAGPTTAQTPGLTTAVRAYFFLGSFTESGGLAPVGRNVLVLEPAGEAIERATVSALLTGPNDVELGARPAMYTTIPAGTRLLGLSLDGAVVTVDLSGEFASGGTAIERRGRLAQVVYTLTQFSGISGVRFAIDGVPITELGDSGVRLDGPVDRADFTDDLPAVFLDTPVWGGVLENPARLTGLANVFEAVFHVRILDAGGRSLADGPVMATCGTGCWGTFEVTVPYVVAAAAAGTLQVYELSAQDGSIINLTEYPVTLTP